MWRWIFKMDTKTPDERLGGNHTAMQDADELMEIIFEHAEFVRDATAAAASD